MTDKIGIYLAQLNPTVGDISGNLSLIRNARQRACDLGASILVTSELIVSGYPPEDLLLRPAFMKQIEQQVEAFVRETVDGGPAVALGVPWLVDGSLRNAVLIIDKGVIIGTCFKNDLPNYGVFDEKRLFVPGPLAQPIKVCGINCGFMICEDMWTNRVTEALQSAGAELLFVLNSSPFDVSKCSDREILAKNRVAEAGLPLIYVNQTGGQDELVFDGSSFVLNADTTKPVALPQWRPAEQLTWWRYKSSAGWKCDEELIPKQSLLTENIYSALVLGLRDYIEKNGFPGVLIGLSGGIDSALTAVIAVDALGSERVRCIMMPSKYTSEESIRDAEDCASRLGVRYESINVESSVEKVNDILKGVFTGTDEDQTEENIQARTRGMILMALSNKFGEMLLATGNKSEMSVGYATLYGDMCGGFSILKDIYKTTVFEMAIWRNENMSYGSLGPSGDVIPQSIINKPPSAELRPNQTDQDSLPPYEILDEILAGLIEGERSKAELISRGQDPAVVNQVSRLLIGAEYKRRQAAPGIKITDRSFGRERRYPITNQFHEQA